MNNLLEINTRFHVSSLVKYHWKRCNQCMKLLSSQPREQHQTIEGPLQLYSQKVSDGTLSNDDHQEIVVQHLQDLYKEVNSFQRPNITSSRSLFSFFRKSKPEKIVAPKGLYIYGSVGGGKTMLMDLFYETAPVSEKTK